VARDVVDHQILYELAFLKKIAHFPHFLLAEEDRCKYNGAAGGDKWG
jgi:hypothetical protein